MGWVYWAWKYYDDPTGSSAEGLVLPNGNYSPIVTVLSRTYPQAVAGIANSVLFNPFTGCFLHGLHAERSPPRVDGHRHGRVAALPERLVRGGEGRRVGHLGPGATHLTIQTTGRPLQVYISVTAGAARPDRV